MNIPNKTLINGFSMPVFGLGTWGMGGRKERDVDNDDQADIVAIQNAVDAGITHIDTAESYANGYTEELVGKAIKDYDRSSLFIASKVREVNLAYDDVLAAVERSLKRLETDYLDLYYIHKPSLSIPIIETMKAMDRLKEEGLIRNIAVSNFSVERFEQAQQVSANKIVANQLHLNLKYREPERKGLVTYCQENDVLLVAWRPVQKGLFAQEENSLLKEICDKYKKTPLQVAINWLISQKNIVTLSKTRTKEHLEENLGALGWEMSSEDIKLLYKEFPDQQDFSDAEPLV